MVMILSSSVLISLTARYSVWFYAASGSGD